VNIKKSVEKRIFFDIYIINKVGAFFTKKNTYRKTDGANMGGKILFNKAT
jgi:hypothetical protein